MPQLRLGPLPKVGLVRLTITLSEPLKEELDQYASEHGRLYEPVETAALIPHMLQAFIRSDRGWRSRKAKGSDAPRRVPTLPGNAATSRNSDGDDKA